MFRKLLSFKPSRMPFAQSVVTRRQISTYAFLRERIASSNLWRMYGAQPHPVFTTLYRLLTAAGAGAATLLFLHQLYHSNIKDPVLDNTIDIDLSRNGTRETTPLRFINEDQLISSGDLHLPGRSDARKVYFLDENGEQVYCYHKETFTRSMLINELVVGTLGKLLMDHDYPIVYAVQKPLKNDSSRSQFSFLSGSLFGVDLEEWCRNFSHDKEEYKLGPRHLGLALAFDMLFGKSDIKLANLVVKRATEEKGRCYSIDHESAFNKPPVILADAKQALGLIGEFHGKTFNALLREEVADGMLDTSNDPNQPLKDQFAIKNAVSPILLSAIQADMDDGKVTAFYKRFAALDDKQFEKAFAPFAGFIRDDEKASIISRLKDAQALVREHLQHRQDSAPPRSMSERVASHFRSPF